MDIKNKRILLVDDEEDIIEFLSYNLRKEGFEIETAQSGKEAILTAKTFKPDLILLDVMMPEMDGIETCEEIRNIPEISHTLVAFLTARSEDYSQIAGFDAGGDDYISKPIKPKVLISRIKALLKRAQAEKVPAKENTNEESGDIKVDRDRYIIIKGDQEIVLPRKEFELLTLLLSKPEKVFTRDEIFKRVWGEDIIVGDRTIDVHIRKLREKIGDEHIKTVKGVGYKYVS